MITDKDISKLKQVFASKDDLSTAVKELKNEIVKFKDEIVGRLNKIDDELTVTNGYGDQLEDHDNRLKKVEKHLNLSSDTS